MSDEITLGNISSLSSPATDVIADNLNSRP